MTTRVSTHWMAFWNTGRTARSLISRLIDPIRIAAIVPHGEARDVLKLVEELQESHEPRERRDYLRAYPGFSAIFRVGIRKPDAATLVELPSTLDQTMKASSEPWTVLADAVTRAVKVLERTRDSFDVVLVISHCDGVQASSIRKPTSIYTTNVKAVTAQARIPCQIIRDDKALSYHCRASVTWRIGIALYCKAGWHSLEAGR